MKSLVCTFLQKLSCDADAGVDKKDIKLSVDGDVLSLSVQKDESKEVCMTHSACTCVQARLQDRHRCDAVGVQELHKRSTAACMVDSYAEKLAICL